MKTFGYKTNTTHQAIIFEIGTEAESDDHDHVGDTPGMIVGSSEWGFISEDNGRRICAALKFFSEMSTEEIERMANERFTNDAIHAPLLPADKPKSRGRAR
jgi:hypothetical protein